MAEYNPKCYLWNDPSISLIPLAKTTIEKKLDINESLETLCCTSITGSGEAYDDIPSIQAFLLNLCRGLNLLPNQRTTYIGTRDHFLALRLIVDSAYRKKSSDKIVTTSDITFCHRQYVKSILGISIASAPEVRAAVSEYKEFVQKSNAVNDWILCQVLEPAKEKLDGILSRMNFFILGTPAGAQELALLKLLSSSRDLWSVFVETPLDNSFCVQENEDDVQITLEECNWDKFQQGCNDTPFTQLKGSSVTQRYVEETMCALLRLVVNTCDMLALVKALMCPLVSLPPKAFLHIKSSASLKRLSLCQTVISYVAKVRLGGRNNVPPNDCPLREYLPHLEIFVDLLLKLQTILEEERKPEVAVRKLITTLRFRFRNCAQELREDAIQAATDRLTNLCDSQAPSVLPGPAVSVSKEPSVSLFGMSRLMPASKGIAGMATVCLLQRLLDRSSSWQRGPLPAPSLPGSRNGTPISGPSPLTFFRTPDQEIDFIPALSQRIAKKNDTPVCTRKFNAGLPWGDNGTNNKLPESKPLVILQSEEELKKPEYKKEFQMHLKPVRASRKGQAKKGVKRAILSDLSNQCVSAAKKPREAPKNKESIQSKKLDENHVQQQDPKLVNKSHKEEINTNVKKTILGNLSAQSDQNAKKEQRGPKSKKPIKGQRDISIFFQNKTLKKT